MDLKNLTDADLRVLITDAIAEEQARQAQQRMLDRAWQLVGEAKRAGYTKGQVAKALTDVVNKAFGEMG